MSLNPVWSPVALTAVAERDACIPSNLRLSSDFIARYPLGSDVRPAASASGLMTEKELQITNPSNDATSILSAIKDKRVTSVEVTTAFIKRAAIGHQMLCCLTQMYFDEGLARAKELDEHYERTGQLVGPLHGLPISVKESMLANFYTYHVAEAYRLLQDHMGVKGKRATGGFPTDLDKLVSTEHGQLNQILWDAGCVFYCKTNLPQSIMHLETYSFWGQTLNPHNTRLTPGGSSGGCSALVSFGGSPMSIGSDIGGSLRSPAACCGIYTLKPTTGRCPSNGLRGCSAVPGNDAIIATYGPIARSLRDIDLFFEVILAAEPWNQNMALVPLPWRSSPVKWSGDRNKIRLGVMWNDGNVLPQPPIRRALKAMVSALSRTDAFEIVDYEPQFHKNLVLMAQRLYFPDGGSAVRQRAAATNDPLCHLTEWVITLPGVKDHTTHEHWNLHLERDALRAKYYQYWNSQKIDVLLCPAIYGPAQVLQTTKYWGYTSAFNCADFPAAVFPTGLTVDPALDPEDTEPREPWSEDDARVFSSYKPEELRNAPLCLQLVSKRHADEVVMQALKEIEKVLPLQN